MKPDPAFYPAPAGAGRTGDDDEDIVKARALHPLAREIADYVGAKLPPGTDYGVFLVRKPNGTPGDTGEVLALTSDRMRLVHPVASWVLQTLKPRRNTKSMTVDHDGAVTIDAPDDAETLATLDVVRHRHGRGMGGGKHGKSNARRKR